MSTGPEAGRRGYLIPLVVAALIAADYVTKRMIEGSFRMGERRSVISGFFDLTFIKNTGAAFGFLADVDSVWVQRGFTAFTLVALVAVVLLYRSMEQSERVGRASLVMIGSGAVGNFIDRLREGAVTDFLLVYVNGYYWPAFNVADSLISVGVVLLAYTILFHTPPEAETPPDTD